MLENGELIQRAEESGFELLLSTDENIKHQQDLSNRKIALVILGNSQWPVVREHLDTIVQAINGSMPGSYVVVPLPFMNARTSPLERTP